MSAAKDSSSAARDRLGASRILVTGFAPFLGQTVNPSQKIVEALAGTEGVDTIVLPVTFAEAFAELERKVDAGNYEIVIAFGQARKRSRISLERVALNWIETTEPDEKGVRPEPRRIFEAGPSAYLSPLPLQQWCAQMNADGIRTEVSFSAGGYVCNFLYYSLCASLEPHQKGLFVHVPSLPEQVEIGEACMDFSEMLKGARFVVKTLAQSGPTV